MQFLSDETGSRRPIRSVGCSRRFWDRATPSLMTGNGWNVEGRLLRFDLVDPHWDDIHDGEKRMGRTLHRPGGFEPDVPPEHFLDQHLQLQLG